MEWYYALNGQQTGPVNETEFNRLVSTGVIRPDTLVWNSGLAEWQPYAKVQAAAPAAPAAPGGAPGVVCAQCGGTFPPDQVVNFGSAAVCASCKPNYLQRLREGASTYSRTGARTLPVDPDELIREIKSRDYTVDIGGCLSRAWELLKSKLWLIVGTTFLVHLVMQATGAIPFIGIVIALVFNGPLMGGLYAFYLKLARGQPAGVGDGFSGFSKNFAQTMLCIVVISVSIYVWFAPAVIYGFSTGQFKNHFPDALTIMLFLVPILPVFYLSVAWAFALMLVVDMEMNFWTAMRVSRAVVHMHWWSVFGLLLVAGIVGVLGILGCCVGVFFTIPLLYGAMIFCYEDIFGVKQANAS